MHLLNSKDLEWLAWNWRLLNNQSKFKSRKRMVFENFNRTIPMLPSLEQIMRGIILAQIDQFSQLGNNAKFVGIVLAKTSMWKSIFSMVEQVKNFKKPLTPKILSDPNHKLVKTLVYVYSMESFVFSEMNKASRMKDKSKIKFYGAFASALGFIVHCGNRCNSRKDMIVYRGLFMPIDELELKYKEGEMINL